MPDSVGNHLPAAVQAQAAQAYLKEGSVFRAYFPAIGKEKFFAVACTCIHDSDDFGVIVLNSEINVNCNPTPALQSLHIPIYQSDYSFLSWDSFMDCTALFPMGKSQIVGIISSDSANQKGFLLPEHLVEAKAKLKASRTINSDTKKKYGVFY